MPFSFEFRINRSFLKSTGLIFNSIVFELIFLLSLMAFGFMGSKFFGLVGLAFGVLTASITFFFSCYMYISLKFSLSSSNNAKLFGSYLLFYLPFIAGLFTYLWYFEMEINVYLSFVISILFVIVSFFLTFNKRSIMLIEPNSLLYKQIMKNLPKQIQNKIIGLIKRFGI